MIETVCGQEEGTTDMILKPDPSDSSPYPSLLLGRPILDGMERLLTLVSERPKSKKNLHISDGDEEETEDEVTCNEAEYNKRKREEFDWDSDVSEDEHNVEI